MGEAIFLKAFTRQRECAGQVGHDGEYFHAWVQNPEDFAVLDEALAEAEASLVNSSWFQENKERFIWGEEILWCLCNCRILCNAMSPIHQQLIQEAIAAVEDETDVIGILLQGSLARGDGYPTSDLDLFLLLRDGAKRAFVATEQQGILVEYHASDREHVIAKVRANPMLAYGFIDGRILRDDIGGLAEIAQAAQEVVASYHTPPKEREGILYWLQSSRIKIRAANEAGDLLKASFVVATTTWKILEGVWAVNDQPMPPSGTVLARRNHLPRVPDDWDSLFTRLFLGDDTRERNAAALAIIDWLLADEVA